MAKSIRGIRTPITAGGSGGSGRDRGNGDLDTGSGLGLKRVRGIDVSVEVLLGNGRRSGGGRRDFAFDLVGECSIVLFIGQQLVGATAPMPRGILGDDMGGRGGLGRR